MSVQHTYRIDQFDVESVDVYSNQPDDEPPVVVVRQDDNQIIISPENYEELASCILAIGRMLETEGEIHDPAALTQ